jgi:dihydroorotate dehydrogenase
MHTSLYYFDVIQKKYMIGGVFNAEDAYEKIKRGSSLVQLITGMIYEGPQLVGEINRGLVQLLKRDGYKNISEAVGASF